MFLLAARMVSAAPVLAQWLYDEERYMTDRVQVALYERLSADSSRLVATSQIGETSVIGDFGPGIHSSFLVVSDSYGEVITTEPVLFKIITLRHQASSNMKDWTDTAVTHELEQPARQYRTLIEIP